MLGPSGAGKTTTLRAIAGLEKLDVGSVHLDGLDATRATPAERDLAMVFQSYALYPKRTAFDNIASPLRARKQTRTEIRTAVERVAELLHIERLMDRKPAQLSGGEMQRVALARALVRDPRAFLMDEPLTNLDLKLRVEMRTELTRIHRSLGGTFLYVTNDQVEAHLDGRPDRRAPRGRGPAGRRAAGDLRAAGQPLGRGLRRQPADEPAALPAGGRRARRRARLVAAAPAVGTGEAGRPLLLGLRAEDLSLDHRDESASLAGALYAVEPLGDRTLVDVDVGGALVKVKARPGAGGAQGEPLQVAVDLDRAHLFDAETGDAIAR